MVGACCATYCIMRLFIFPCRIAFGLAKDCQEGVLTLVEVNFSAWYNCWKKHLFGSYRKDFRIVGHWNWKPWSLHSALVRVCCVKQQVWVIKMASVGVVFYDLSFLLSLKVMSSSAKIQHRRGKCLKGYVYMYNARSFACCG